MIQDDTSKALLDAFCEARSALMKIEELIGHGPNGWKEEEVKAMDKGVCLAKVGVKFVKKVLKGRGYPAAGREAKRRHNLNK